jgi:hypothetical protein
MSCYLAGAPGAGHFCSPLGKATLYALSSSAHNLCLLRTPAFFHDYHTVLPNLITTTLIDDKHPRYTLHTNMPFWRRKRVGRTYTRSSTVEKGKGRAQPQAHPTAALNERAHLLDHEVIAKKLKADTQDGLTDTEAQSRLEEYVLWSLLTLPEIPYIFLDTERML